MLSWGRRNQRKGEKTVLYCEKCHNAVENDGETRCPFCGGKKLRPIRGDDPCFLAEKDQIWSEVVEDFLNGAGIPFLTKGRMGAGLAINVGPMFVRYRYYVNYGDLARAKEVLAAVFAESGDGEKEEE